MSTSRVILDISLNQCVFTSIAGILTVTKIPVKFGSKFKC